MSLDHLSTVASWVMLISAGLLLLVVLDRHRHSRPVGSVLVVWIMVGATLAASSATITATNFLLLDEPSDAMRISSLSVRVLASIIWTGIIVLITGRPRCLRWLVW